MIIETERLFLREMDENDFDALYEVLADADIMQHYPYTFDENRVRNWIQRNIERYRIFGFGLWAVCLKETGEMIGDWTFDNTPFNIVYSYMKNTNEPSYKTAVSYGCKQVESIRMM